MFDWTINFGNLLTFTGFVVGGLIFVLAMKGDIRLLAQRLTALEADVDQIAKVIVEMARQGERLSAMDRRISDLANRTYRLETGRELPMGGVTRPGGD